MLKPVGESTLPFKVGYHISRFNTTKLRPVSLSTNIRELIGCATAEVVATQLGAES
jgi:hypothetical protein